MTPTRPRSAGSTPGEYLLSEDPADLDLDRIHGWLSDESYWAPGRPRDVVERSFAGSSPAGIYTAGQQVAVARIVSDGVTFAWLCDVFVDRGHRGRGLGTRLARWSADWIGRRGIPRILLATADAHGVYAAVGFEPIRNPHRWMQIDRRPAQPLAPGDDRSMGTGRTP